MRFSSYEFRSELEVTSKPPVRFKPAPGLSIPSPATQEASSGDAYSKLNVILDMMSKLAANADLSNIKHRLNESLNVTNSRVEAVEGQCDDFESRISRLERAGNTEDDLINRRLSQRQDDSLHRIYVIGFSSNGSEATRVDALDRFRNTHIAAVRYAACGHYNK